MRATRNAAISVLVLSVVCIAAAAHAGAEDALGEWVPPKLLAAALLALLGAGVAVFGFVGRGLMKRLDSLDSAVEHATTEIAKLGTFATREQVSEGMSNMGNRFDERVGKLREENSRLEVRIARLEERSTTPARSRK